ncbi:hypothetical protein [Streptomyces sp. NPDC005096]|uniref:hypothetical protein n=1 Tax=Streptomyces sp. NPDC005096 TaxID=3154559 RepID=UPI0033A955DD
MARILLTTDHVHGPGRRRFSPPTAYEEKDLGAVVGLAAQLYDAVLDDCPDCRQDLLAHLAQDSATAGVLVGWACLIVSETYGGLPEILLDGSERDDAPFHPTAAFRSVACAYEDAGPTGVYAACAAYTAGQLLEAAETSLEVVVGLADFGVDFLYQ